MNGLTSREQKALEHSWAKTFAEGIFPAIDEEPFSVLYSSNAVPEKHELQKKQKTLDIIQQIFTTLFNTPRMQSVEKNENVL